MNYPRSIPDDYRRNLWNLETLLDRAQFYPEEGSETDTLHAHVTPETADEMKAQLEATPRNVLIVQTTRGRFQITVGDVLTIACLDAHAGVSIRPTASNIIEIRSVAF